MAFPSSHESGLIFPPPHQTHQLLPDFHCLKRSISFSGTEDGNGEDGEGCPSAAGKKRRLSLQQVRALERSFEAGVKLEPDRKLQLAAALGLQPRQIAVWFQNRRARWKTKQLEKDFEQLKLQLQALKHENDDLRDQNQKFHARLLALRNREATGPPAPAAGKLGKEAEDSWSFVTESNSEIVDVSRTPPEAAADGFRPPTASEAGFRPPESDGVACERFAAAVRDEGLIFSVIGGGVEDRLGLWSWAEQQHHHFG